MLTYEDSRAALRDYDTHRAMQSKPNPLFCPHPPARVRAWFARDDSQPTGQVVVVACCDCGAVLTGSAEEPQP